MSSTSQQALLLSDDEDPDGHARRIKKAWGITEKLVLGFQKGVQVFPCDYKRFHKGDFIDVLASVDISTFKRHGQSVVSVRLRPRRIIQLMPATRISDILASSTQAAHMQADDFQFDVAGPASNGLNVEADVAMRESAKEG